MNDSLSAVQARISELRSRIDSLSGHGAPGSSSGAATFAGMLAQAMGDGTAGAGTVGSAAGGAGLGTGAGAATGLIGAAGALSGLTVGQSGDLGAQAVASARQYIGVPYVWGGEDPRTGVDCSGLVQYVYGKLGIKLPRVSQDQAHVGRKVDSLSQARPGDLVFFGEPAHHVGIYVGDGKMIDAPHRGATVGVHKVWGSLTSIRRVTPESPATAGPLTSGTLGSGALGSGALGSSAPSGPYAELFTDAGRRYGVDPLLLSAVARAESGYNPRAVSGVGARGLMQIMPGPARELGVDPDDPAQAVDGAARLLRQLLDRFGGRVDLALAGYNAGPGAVQRYGGVPPYTETQNYVRRVTQYRAALSAGESPR